MLSQGYVIPANKGSSDVACDRYSTIPVTGWYDWATVLLTQEVHTLVLLGHRGIIFLLLWKKPNTPAVPSNEGFALH